MVRKHGDIGSNFSLSWFDIFPIIIKGLSGSARELLTRKDGKPIMGEVRNADFKLAGGGDGEFEIIDLYEATTRRILNGLGCDVFDYELPLHGKCFSKPLYFEQGGELICCITVLLPLESIDISGMNKSLEWISVSRKKAEISNSSKIPDKAVARGLRDFENVYED